MQKKYNSVMKSVSGKQIAVAVPSKVLIPVGTRVAAVFHDMDIGDNFVEKLDASNFYSGVIAEPPKSTNKYRLMIIRDIFILFFFFPFYILVLFRKLFLCVVDVNSLDTWCSLTTDTYSMLYTKISLWYAKVLLEFGKT